MKLDVTDIPTARFTFKALGKRLEGFHVENSKLDPTTEPTILVITPQQQGYMTSGLSGQPWTHWRGIKLEVRR